MIEEMNTGRIRILFGSTDMLGTGVNAQRRCVAIHHLDSPWRPSDLEQREGRGIRKGNEVAKLYADNQVDVIIYAVEKSLDAYKFGLLHNKQLFIRQLKHNNLGVRTIDEGGMDEGSGMNFSEYVAVLSGNTDLLEKARLEKEDRGAGERASGVRARQVVEPQPVGTYARGDRKTRRQDRAHRKKTSKPSEAVRNSTRTVRTATVSRWTGWEQRPAVHRQQLNHIAKTVDTGSGEKRIGSIYGFEIIVKSEKSMKEDFESIRNRFMCGEKENTSTSTTTAIWPETRARRRSTPLHALGTIEPTLEKFRKERASLEKDAPAPADHRGYMAQRSRPRGFEKEMERLDQIQLALKTP